MSNILVYPEMSACELQRTASGPLDSELLIIAHHPGEAEFYWPVLPHLAAVSGLRTIIMATGCARESLIDLTDVHLRPLDDADVREVCGPNALVATGAAISPDLVMNPDAPFERNPHLLAGEYYGSVALHLERCASEGWRLPDQICTFDDFDQTEIALSHPYLNSRIDVTGQPAFDYIAERETIDKRRETARSQLDISPEDTLVSCFATVGATALVQEFARELANAPQGYKVAFNKHPRDQTDASVYVDIFDQADVTICNSADVPTRHLIAAADVVAILPHSTLALHAIQHGIPTIHVEATPDGPGSQQVPVRRGVSPHVAPTDFLSTARELLDISNERGRSLLERMAMTYPVTNDGAARVAKYIGDTVRIMCNSYV